MTKVALTEDDMNVCNRNVSIAILVASITLLSISIVFERKIKLISDGIMLGGLFTLLYSIGRGFASDDGKYVFVVVSICLVVVLYLGYHRFGKVPKVSKKK
jgi:xanthine/uracil permease